MSGNRQAMVPTRSDWGEIDSNNLDAQWALEQFLGKSFAEAESLFAENALHYGEALVSMPPLPYNFYAPALAKYLTSDKARGDSDGASSYLRWLAWVLEKRPEIVDAETKLILLRAAEHVAAHQPFYEASASIYGRFSELLNRIKRLSRRPPRQ